MLSITAADTFTVPALIQNIDGVDMAVGDAPMPTSKKASSLAKAFLSDPPPSITSAFKTNHEQVAAAASTASRASA